MPAKEHPQNVHWTHEQRSAKKWEGQPWDCAHIKRDGWRVTFFRQPSRVTPIVGYGKDRTKSGVRRTDLEFLYRFPRLRDDPIVKVITKNFPSYSSVDCEILTADASRSDVTTALRNPDIPIVIEAFAVPMIRGIDCAGHELEVIHKLCYERDVPFIPFKPRSWFGTGEVDRDRLLNNIVPGSEGWVLKHRGQYGKWFKVKREPTIDCVITGYIPGQGKYKGLIGALVVSVYDDDKLVEVASLSGMTDEQRYRLSSYNFDREVKGQVVEVKYQMIGAGGRLVHPRYVRMRPDKPRDQCTIDQLETGE